MEYMSHVLGILFDLAEVQTLRRPSKGLSYQPYSYLQGHVQGQTQKHLQLISDRLSKMAQLQSTAVTLETGTSEDAGSFLTRTYSGSTLQSTQKLLKDLFARHGIFKQCCYRLSQLQ